MEVSSKTKKWFVIALAVCLVCVFIASLILSNFGKTQVSYYRASLTDIAAAIQSNNEQFGKDVEVTFTEDTLAEMEMKVFKPSNATEENKVPALVFMHGGDSNLEPYHNLGTELPRRGFALIVFDGAGHGSSDLEVNELTHESYGMEAAVEYVMSLPYVDETQVCVGGHSMGNLGSLQALNHINVESRNHIAGWLQGNGSLYVTQLLPEAAEGLKHGIIIAKYDEYDTMFFDSYHIADTEWATSWAKEIYPEFNSDVIDLDTWYTEQGAQPLGTSLDVDKARIVINPPTIHNGMWYSPTIMTYISSFLYDSFGVPNGVEEIAPTQQLWLIVTILVAIAMIAWLALVPPLLDMLLSTTAFSSLRTKRDLSKGNLPSYKVPREWGTALLIFGIITIFSLIMVLPIFNKGVELLPATTFFPLGGTSVNGMALWMFTLGLFGIGVTLAVLVLKIKIYKKANIEMPDPAQVLRISFKDILLTVILTLCAFAIMWAILYAVKLVFHLDFRLFSVQFRTFPPERFPIALRYCLLFGVNQCVMAFFVSTCRYKDAAEWAEVAIVAGLGLICVLVLHWTEYFSLLTTGVPGLPTGGTAIMDLRGTILGAIVAPIFARYIFNRTGNIWLAVCFNTLFFTATMAGVMGLNVTTTLFGV